jgi:hypothetical protein
MHYILDVGEKAKVGALYDTEGYSTDLSTKSEAASPSSDGMARVHVLLQLVLMFQFFSAKLTLEKEEQRWKARSTYATFGQSPTI